MATELFGFVAQEYHQQDEQDVDVEKTFPALPLLILIMMPLLSPFIFDLVNSLQAAWSGR